MRITDFLEARIAEDEERAEYVLKWGDWGGLFKPPRVLAECAAKRAIIAASREDYEDSLTRNDDTIELGTIALYALASVYSSHPDYQHKWAP
jgi:hypothetical protein